MVRMAPKYALALLSVSHIFVSTGAFASQPQEFFCKTSKQTIVVDRPGDAGTYRYRSWSLSKKVGTTPDLEMNEGTKAMQGHGACQSTEWSFQNGSVRFALTNNVSCTERKPPKEAIGSMYVFVNDVLRNEYWCTS